MGLDPDRASAAFIRNVLTSDLSDPGSMANQLADTRYRNLAAAFSFDEDGNAPPGGAAQTAAQLDQTVFENYTQGGPSPAGAAYNSTYYANTVPRSAPSTTSSTTTGCSTTRSPPTGSIPTPRRR